MFWKNLYAQHNDERDPAFSGVKTAKIIVTQYYGNTEKKVELPFEKIMAGFLQYAGIIEDSINYDIIVRIDAQGYAIEGTYRDISNSESTVKSGASLKGSVVFETTKGDKFTEIFNEKITPPYSIDWLHMKDPFMEAFKETWATLLKSIYKPLGITPLFDALKNKDYQVRNAAAKALGKINDRRAVEPLIATLNNYGASFNVVEALGIMVDSRSVEPLIAVLKNEDNGVEGYNIRLYSIRALKKIKDSRAIEPLISILIDKEPGIYAETVKALDVIDTNWRNTESAKKSIPVFIEALKDKDWNVRRAAVVALGEIKDNQTVEPLIGALNDSNSEVRKTASYELGEIKDIRAVEPLIAALKDENEYNRRIAADALGKIKDTRAIEPLINALKDHSCPRPEEALEQITGKNFGEDATKMAKMVG